MAHAGMLVDCRKCPSLLHQQEVIGQQSPMQVQHKESIPHSHDQNQYSHGPNQAPQGFQLREPPQLPRPNTPPLLQADGPHRPQPLLDCLTKMPRKCPSRRLWEADQFKQGLVLPTWKIMSHNFMNRGYMFFSLVA